MVAASVIPDPALARIIEDRSQADSNLCWTCSSCDNECPINIATNRLRPQKIVRMANLGMLEDLLRLPEIWYCLNCVRCQHVCPNQVQPFSVINYLRDEAVRRRIVSGDAVQRRQGLLAQFQRVRWHAVKHCFRGNLRTISDDTWHRWMRKPVRGTVAVITQKAIRCTTGRFRKSVSESNTWSCLTCSECSSCCPVCFERSVFDPQLIIRMASLGLEKEILASPSIWLCLDCGRCSSACSQQVKGRDIIHRLQSLAIEEAFVDDQFARRLKDAERVIYPRLLAEIDTLMDISR